MLTHILIFTCYANIVIKDWVITQLLRQLNCSFGAKTYTTITMYTRARDVDNIGSKNL